MYIQVLDLYLHAEVCIHVYSLYIQLFIVCIYTGIFKFWGPYQSIYPLIRSVFPVLRFVSRFNVVCISRFKVCISRFKVLLSRFKVCIPHPGLMYVILRFEVFVSRFKVCISRGEFKEFETLLKYDWFENCIQCFKI